MLQLKPEECRVLGTLIEKAQTTPNQYPLTLNALTNGCNQKNNRDPLTELSEDEVLEAVDGLKSKGLAREAILSGSRVNKFRHTIREALSVNVAEMAVLAELMLRGPQSPGELKTRAERMVPAGTEPALRSPEDALAVLGTLMAREEPLVRHLGRRTGERADRYAQLLCPELHRLDGPVERDAAAPRTGGRETEGVPAEIAELLARRIEELEQKVSSFEQRLDKLEWR